MTNDKSEPVLTDAMLRMRESIADAINCINKSDVMSAREVLIMALAASPTVTPTA